jgi:hypothetical protein
MNKLIKKIRTLTTNPTAVYYKYKGKFKYILVKLLGGIPPIYKEDYDRHWNFTTFKNKVILDLGADYGSTAYYFLLRGASRIIAVEGDPQLGKKLKRNFQEDKRVICVNCFIDEAKQISDLILRYHPDLIKVDIEGNEKLIHGLFSGDLKGTEWLIEAHIEELYESLKRFFVNNQFKVRSYQYTDNLKILHVF